MKYKNNVLPSLSVVIPTRNRIPYAISTIQSILEIPDPRLELVVQDNSDSRDLEFYVHESIKDKRLRYRYTPPPLSLIDNFNAAMELATGKYVCLIGDDDGVNPEILEAAVWAEANDLDALSSRCIPAFLWNNTGLSSTLFSRFEGGELSIKEFSRKILVADVRREVYKLIRNGGVYYHSFFVPKLYHGLVRRRCMDDIHEKIGAYFGGLSPDIFSVLAISEIAERTLFIDYPLTIAGVCPDSGGTYKKKGKFKGSVGDTFLMRDRGQYHWCELVPRVYCAETIWVDSGVAALRAMGRDDLVQELNLPKLAAYCIGANRGIKEPVLREMFIGLRRMGKSPVVGAMQFAWSLLTGPGIKFFWQAWNRLQVIMGMKIIHRVNGLENMIQVSHALTRCLKKNGYSFSDCVQGIKYNITEKRDNRKPQNI